MLLLSSSYVIDWRLKIDSSGDWLLEMSVGFQSWSRSSAVSQQVTEATIPAAGASTGGKVDATCVQIGLRGKRITPWRGGIPGQTDRQPRNHATATCVYHNCEIGRFLGALAHQNEIRPHHCVSFCSRKVKYWIAAVLKQKCARMHQILFQFPFFSGNTQTPAIGGSAPRPLVGEGRGAGRGRERRGKGRGKFASLPLGDRRPCNQHYPKSNL